MTLSCLLDAFKGKEALIVGDLMLDEYIFGSAMRISPEAPVIVIRQERTQLLPGGAANVARNVVALGGEASLVGVVGCDGCGDLLESELNAMGLRGIGLVRDPQRSTTRKTRVVADHSHQVLRIDAEQDSPLPDEAEVRLIEESLRHLPRDGVLIISDYLKGALTAKVAAALLDAAKKRGLPTVVNPKPRSLPQYRGADLLSLNRAEVSEALNRAKPITDAEAEDSARSIKESVGVEGVLVTLGERGMVAIGKETVRVSAPRVEVYDTAGAGDTVVATAGLGLATVGFDKSVFELAAQTAACVVRHVGVATPSKEDLAQIRNGAI